MSANHSTLRSLSRKQFGEQSGWAIKLCWCLALLLVISAPLWAVHREMDDAGRSVAVPDQVHRIVSLSPSLTDIVYALGAQDALVGITDYTDYPPEAARQKPSVGAIVNPSLEKIFALHPDLVLALPAFNGAETIAGLQHLGLPVFLFNTSVVSDIYRNIASVGKVLGREQQSSALIAQLRLREEGIKQQSSGKPRPKVLVVVAIEPLITAGRSAFMTEMITGGRSRIRDAGHSSGLAADESGSRLTAQAGLHRADPGGAGNAERYAATSGMELAGSGATGPDFNGRQPYPDTKPGSVRRLGRFSQANTRRAVSLRLNGNL